MAVCNTCQCYKKLGFDIKMAFQPIVNVREQTVYAHEALVRGSNGEGAGEVLGKVTSEMIYSFDQKCRMTAIETAARVNIPSRVSINFLPNAIYEPETCLARTLETANRVNFPKERIIFEVTEHEKIENQSLLKEVFKTYKEHGFLTAIDDFGEGYAGLNMLSEFQPDLLKVDMNLIRNIDKDKIKRSIVKGVLSVAGDLGITTIAEGIETEDEKKALSDLGIDLMQGFYFCKPQLESSCLPYGFRPFS